MNRFNALSDRQAECLRLIGRGLSAKQIASELDLSTETVNAHLKAARRTLGVGRSLEAARLLMAADQAGNASGAPESVGTHPMGIPNHSPTPPSATHQMPPAGHADDDGGFELRDARTTFLFEEVPNVHGAMTRGRFGDLTPARRMLMIIAVMIGCVVTVAGLAAIAGSLQAILWSIKSGH